MYRFFNLWARIMDFPNKNDSEAPINWKEYKARVKYGDGIDHTLSITSKAIDIVRRQSGGRSGPRAGY